MSYQNNCKYVLYILAIALLSLFSPEPPVYSQNESARTIAENADPIVYHLSSDDPWRASIALSAMLHDSIGF